MPTLNEIAEKIVRATAKNSVRDIVREQVKNLLSGNDPSVTEERVQELLDKAGFTDEYIAEKTDELIDAVYAENATVQNVSEKPFPPWKRYLQNSRTAARKPSRAQL